MCFKNKSLLFFCCFVLFLPGIFSADAPQLSYVHSLDIGGDNVHLTIEATLVPGEDIWQSLSANFLKENQWTNFKAFNAVTGNELKTNEVDRGERIYYSAQFDSPALPKEEYILRMEWDSKKILKESSPDNNLLYVFWGFGDFAYKDINYPLPCYFRFILPAGFDVSSAFSDDGYERKLENGRINIYYVGVAPPGSHFEKRVVFEPVFSSFKIVKEVTEDKIYQEEAFQVKITVINIGTSPLFDLNVYGEFDTSAFELVGGESNCNKELLEKTEEFQCNYSLRSLLNSGKFQLSEAKGTAVDLLGEKLELESAKLEIEILSQKETVVFFGLPIPLEKDSFQEDPLYYILAFFACGYLALFWTFVFIKKEYQGWRQISSMDKVIYSLFLSGINYALSIWIAVTLIITLLVLVFLPLEALANLGLFLVSPIMISKIISSKELLYFSLAVSIPFTSDLTEKSMLFFKKNTPHYFFEETLSYFSISGIKKILRSLFSFSFYARYRLEAVLFLLLSFALTQSTDPVQIGSISIVLVFYLYLKLKHS